MTILRYHGFTNWQTRMTEQDDPRKDTTFGIELEVQRISRESPNCEKMASLLTREFGDLFVYENDSSIGEGFEIISQPVSWRWFRENLHIFRNMLTMLNEHGYRSHDGNKCGLHIHVGRTALQGPTVQGGYLRESNVITNIMYTLERFQNEFFRFSRRTKTSLNDWSKFRTELLVLDSGQYFIDKKKMGSYVVGNSGTRYHALNLKNSATIEFRLFRGTLRFETFFLTMNLVKNCVEQAKISHNVISFDDLVREGLSDEENLWADEYLCSRRICSEALLSFDTVIARPRLQSRDIHSLVEILDD